MEETITIPVDEVTKNGNTSALVLRVASANNETTSQAIISILHNVANKKTLVDPNTQKQPA